ncbi:Homeodomain-like protein, partial [Tribonema minus]
VSRGYKNWGQLAAHMPGRTSKQCRERWIHHLDPAINKSDYTAEEDAKILALQKDLGNKWSQIALHLPGRTENAIKIRW